MPVSKRQRHGALVAQKSTISQRLEALRGQRSQALISGEEFTGGLDIRTLADELTALDSAIAAVDQQATEEEDREIAAFQAQARETDAVAIDEKTELFIRTVGEIEQYVHLAVRGLAKLNELATEIDTIALPLSGEMVITSLQHQNIAMRMSERMGRVFAKLDPRSMGGYGLFRWPPETPRAEDWMAEERAELQRITPYVKRQLQTLIDKLRARAGGE